MKYVQTERDHIKSVSDITRICLKPFMYALSLRAPGSRIAVLENRKIRSQSSITSVALKGQCMSQEIAMDHYSAARLGARMSDVS